MREVNLHDLAKSVERHEELYRAQATVNTKMLEIIDEAIARFEIHILKRIAELEELRSIANADLSSRIAAVRDKVADDLKTCNHNKLNKLLQRNERAWKLYEDFELKFTDRLGKAEHFSKELKEGYEQLFKAQEDSNKNLGSQCFDLKREINNVVNTVTQHWDTQNKIRESIDQEILERIANLEQERAHPKPLESQPTEEIRPQVGEVWETRDGSEQYKIVENTDVDLKAASDNKPLIKGLNIKSNYRKYWLSNGLYFRSDICASDLVKKISDAPKPESKLPQPGEIWLARNKIYNLVLKCDRINDRKLLSVATEGHHYYLYSDGKASKDWDPHGNSMFDLIEKTDLTFADFLKLNKGE